MEKILLLTLILACLAQVPKDCVPFGTRLQYGQTLIQPSSLQKLVISFNTNDECSSSFIRIISKIGIQQINCESKQVATSVLMNYFVTFVQVCSFTYHIQFEQKFNYMVYGWQKDIGMNPIPWSQSWIQINAIHPISHSGPINILALADWGVIEISGLTPVLESLREQMAQKDINLLMVNGDIAYDLDSDNGAQYIGFLQMIEEITCRIPTIFVTGNHQHKSNDDWLLYTQSFKLYNIDTNLTFGFQFGDLYILPFDPYLFVVQQPENVTCLELLINQLQIAKQTSLFILPFSHYPVVCSGEASQCLPRLERMYTYWNAMIDAGVTLYIGAHTHDYERIYPYFNNQTFQLIEGPYSEGQGYLISIVEGVAGNDTPFVNSLEILNNYTAKYTANQTGFGIVTSNTNNEVSYAHYSTTSQGFMDSMTIKKKIKKNKIIQLLQKLSREIY